MNSYSFCRQKGDLKSYQHQRSHTHIKRISRIHIYRMRRYSFFSTGKSFEVISTSTFHTHITGWRRLIGSPKLQIIFHKNSTKYRSLLRKMTYKDKGSYESSPPWNRVSVKVVCHRFPYSYQHPHTHMKRVSRTGWRRPIG